MLPGAPRIELAHTSALPAADLVAARALLFDVFDDMAEDDWEHALGGLHAVGRSGGVLAAHAALVQRRLLHGAARCAAATWRG